MTKEKENLASKNNEFPRPKEFNPIWFLVGMGILIAVVLAVEMLGLKPK